MAQIARTSTTGSTSWSTDTAVLAAADGTVMLASKDEGRAAVTILNDSDSTHDLFLVPTSGQRTGGVRVVPGAGLVLNTTAPVYGYTTGAATVYAVAEFGAPC